MYFRGSKIHRKPAVLAKLTKVWAHLVSFGIIWLLLGFSWDLLVSFGIFLASVGLFWYLLVLFGFFWASVGLFWDHWTTRAQMSPKSPNQAKLRACSGSNRPISGVFGLGVGLCWALLGSYKCQLGSFKPRSPKEAKGSHHEAKRAQKISKEPN